MNSRQGIAAGAAAVVVGCLACLSSVIAWQIEDPQAAAEAVPENEAPETEAPDETKVDMAALMKKAELLRQPGPNHKILERFLGTWTTSTRFSLGGQFTPPETGVAEISWLMEGRWLKSEAEGTLLGMPFEGFMLIGYDNFKMSFVTTMINNLDTAMLHSEGDLDPSGKALLSYGTLDEYLTGEHDKMVKYVWRFMSEDKLVLEVHDLPIGEHNTLVAETTYTRAAP